MPMLDLRLSAFLLVVFTVLAGAGCNSNIARNPDDPSEALYYARQRSGSPANDVWERVRHGMQLQVPDNARVKEFVDWYAERPNVMARMQENAELYLYHIVQKVEERGLPMELALLPAVESNYTPTATSRSGAAGIWQFIPSTGRSYGLEQNKFYDARRDLVASTDAALDYLTYLHDYFDGNWEKAIAAYNAGEGTVERAVRARSNQANDYWSLDLPRETQEYVPRLLALATIVKSPRQHDVQLGRIPNSPPLAQVEINRPVDLGTAAERCGLDKKEFCAINAAYRTSVTKAGGAAQMILVPTHKAEKFKEVVATLPDAKPIVVARNETTAKKDRRKQAPRVSLHVVSKGDTLSSIARSYGMSVDELRARNGVRNNVIKVGQKLSVNGDGRKSIRTAKAVKLKRTYKVKSGDTLWSIARIHKITLDALCQQNRLSKKAVLKPGQTLEIPELINAAVDVQHTAT